MTWFDGCRMRLPFGSEFRAELVLFGFAAAIVFGGVDRVNGATITVGLGAGYDCDAIQAGINTANNGDTVLVSPGEYVITEPISFLGKAITVRSETGPDETTIQMGTSADTNRGSVVVFENNETTASVLEGFTITGGRGFWFPTESAFGCGGILFIASSGTVRDCAIVQNSTDYGGGIGSGYASSPKLIDCTISGNLARVSGGGVFAWSGSSLTLANCIVRGNSAPEEGGGGACCTLDSSMTMTDCTIVENSAGQGGGGVFCGENSSFVTLTNCAIIGNTAGLGGGGLEIWHQASATVINCVIAQNTVLPTGWGGGGVVCSAYGFQGCSATVINSILWGNTAPRGREIWVRDSATFNIGYSSVDGGQAGVSVEGGTLNWGEGNIDADPHFAEPGYWADINDPNKIVEPDDPNAVWIDGDYHLKSEVGRWDPYGEGWLMDDVSSSCIDAGDPDSDWRGELWSHGEHINMGAYGGTPQASMSLPDAGHISDPVNLANDVPVDTDLHWRSDELTAKYDLYFGTSFEDVNNAHTADPMGVLVSQAQEANTYDPGNLDFAQTYFWRVDEANGTPDKTVLKGEVWSFEVEPYSIQIPGSTIAVTASSTSNEFSMPDKTIDDSGLDANDAHNTSSENMWFTAQVDLDPWIQYEFDAVKKLDTMKVWNSNSAAEMTIGWGVKDVEITYSKDGETWDVLADANLFNRATGLPTYNQYDEIDFGGVAAKIVRLNIQSNWGGILMSYGLSEVQFSAIRLAARTPNPDSGAGNVDPRSTVLSWHSGREAGQHDVFVSADPNALDSANTVLDNSLALNSMNLSLDTTYYWQVNEVNDTMVPSTWAGDVWHFTTLSSFSVDDFESYSNLSPYRVFQTWIDGSGFTNPAPGNPGNNTGSDIGHDIWSVASPHFQGSIMETGSTPAGSHLAMPVYYDNSGANGKLTYSQVDYAVGGQDWTAHGLQTLSIAFRGTAGNTGTLYVKINNTKLVYNGDTADIAREQWQQWNIDLTSLDGLQNVTTLTIGVDDANAAGTLYIDDIGLYP